MSLDRRTLLAAGAAGLLPACAPAAPPPPPRPAAWSPRAAMPYRAQEIYCAVIGGRVYTAGGLVGRERGIDIVDRSAVYDAARDTWSEGPRLPAPTHHPAMAELGGRIFALGGFRETPQGQWSAITDVLALDGDRWVEAGRLPAPQSETVALGQGGAIHLITGRSPADPSRNADWNHQADVAAHRVFEPGSGRWRDARPAPQALNSAAGAIIDGRLYLVGGRTVRGGNLAGLHRYDPRTDIWETLRPMPQPAGGIAAASLGGKLYAFGGEWFAPGGGGVYREVWIYDVAANAWTAGPPMRTPRHGLAGAAVGGAVLAIGGASTVSAGDTTAIVEGLA